MREFHSGSGYANETDGLSGVAARKAPVPQESFIMGNAASIRTSEGSIAYAEGWVVTADVKGNLYAFDQAYMNANMDIEGSLATVAIPDGAGTLGDLKAAGVGQGFILRKKQAGIAPVTAYLIDEPFSVATSWGETMNGQTGGYLIEEDRGGTCNRWVVAADVFRQTYLV